MASHLRTTCWIESDVLHNDVMIVTMMMVTMMMMMVTIIFEVFIVMDESIGGGEIKGCT